MQNPAFGEKGMIPIGARALCLSVQLFLCPGFVPWKAGRSVQAGYQAVLQELITAAKSNKPADKAVPVTIFRIIND